VKTVKDLQNIPAQDLITALAASDPRGGLGHVPMIDDILLSENWQTHFNFTRGRGGSVMIGNTGFEGAVITALLAAQPKPASPSSTSSLISLLHGSISADKTQGLVDAYQIHDDPGHLNLYQVKQNILKLLQDLAFYRPPYSSISALKAKTPPSKVYRYAFLKSNIFEGPFHNLSAHALDLAYIHGDSSLFTGTANESSELIFQDKIKEIWINFADGDSIWDDDKWMVMGGKGAPFGLLQRTEVQFENEMDRTSLAWPAVDALSNSDKEAVTSILMGHLVGLGGVDASHVNGGA
jgi:carboxylesterase type B